MLRFAIRCSVVELQGDKHSFAFLLTDGHDNIIYILMFYACIPLAENKWNIKWKEWKLCQDLSKKEERNGNALKFSRVKEAWKVKSKLLLMSWMRETETLISDMKTCFRKAGVGSSR